ncbi:MAG: hypothetical protein ACI37U_10430 [Bacteroides sp.]
MDKDGLLTIEEFNRLVTRWGENVRERARATLLARTHSSGRLADKLREYVDSFEYNGPATRVAFRFERYGVFRSYGVGRGYIIFNGMLVRGYRVRSVRDIQQRRFNVIASEMLKQGYTISEINREKRPDLCDLKIQRTALDWIDKHIDAGINNLADAVQEFYGDDALRQLLDDFPKTKINKTT